MVQYPSQIVYSERYCDDAFEYRHVLVPKDLVQHVRSRQRQRPDRLLLESDWRNLGIQMSLGWINYVNHGPDHHVLCFRRPLDLDPNTGRAMKSWKLPLDDRTKNFDKEYLPLNFSGERMTS